MKRVFHTITIVAWAVAFATTLLSAGCERKKERTVPELSAPLTIDVPVLEISDLQLRKEGNP